MAIPINLLSDKSGSYKSHVDYIGLRDAIAVPTRYVLNITNRCNLRCDMCTQVNEYGNGGYEMEMEMFDKILIQTAWTYPSYTLFGGEPLLHRQFGLFVEKIRKADCKCDIVTNGMLLEKYLNVIVHPKTILHISMSGSEGVHNAIKHSKISYERIMKAIEVIHDKHHDFLENVHINCVVLPDNIDSLEEMINDLSSMGVTRFTIQHPQWEVKAGTDYNKKEWSTVFSKDFEISLEMRKNYNFNSDYINKLLIIEEKLLLKENLEINFYPELKDNDMRLYYDDIQNLYLLTDNVCLVPWMNPTIESNGDVKACMGYTVGNLNSENLWKIWNGETNSKLRSELLLRDDFPICKRCCLFYDKYI